MVALKGKLVVHILMRMLLHCVVPHAIGLSLSFILKLFKEPKKRENGTALHVGYKEKSHLPML